MKRGVKFTTSTIVVSVVFLVAIVALFLVSSPSLTGNAWKPSDWQCSWKLSTKISCESLVDGVRLKEGSKQCVVYTNACSSSNTIESYSCNKASGSIWDMLFGNIVKTDSTTCDGSCTNAVCAPPPCIDNDGDSFGENCIAGPDCNDNNAQLNPIAIEVCDNIDNDCDMVIDEGTTSQTCTNFATCQTYDTCGVCPSAPAEVCGDNIDNDCDSLVDCADSDCEASCEIPSPVLCVIPGTLTRLNFADNAARTTITLDTSGNSRNGVVSGATFVQAGGHDGGAAYQFNGVSNKIDVAGLPLSNHSFTISLWVKPDANPSAEQVVFGIHDSANTQKSLHVRLRSDGSLLFGYYANDLASPSGKINFGSWNHVMVTYDSSSDMSKIYLNGQLVASGSQGPYLGSSSLGTIGYWANSGSIQFVKGTIDDVIILDRAVMPQDLSTNQAASTEVCSDNVDNDCDGLVDCSDNDCASDSACSIPTPPSNDPQIKAYQTYSDTVWAQNKNTFISMSNSGNYNDVYTLQFLIDGLIAMYEATDNATYIDRALMLVENEMASAVPDARDGRIGWPRTDGKSNFVDEARVSEYFSHLGAVIKTNPSLNSVYGSRADAVLTFTENNLLDKWLNDRNFGNYANTWDWVANTQNEPSGTLSGYIQGQQILTSLAVRNMYAAGRTSPAHGTQSWNVLGNIVMGNFTKRLVTKSNGACVWDEGKFLWTDSKTGIMDTFHSNEFPLAAITYYQDGNIVSSSNIQCLAKTFTRNIWNNKTTWPNPTQGKSGSIWMNNYIDGQDINFADQKYNWVSTSHPLYNTYGGMSSGVYSGWCYLGQYDKEAYTACNALYTFVSTYSDNTANPVINRNSAAISKIALSGALAKSLRYKTWN